MIYAVRNRRQLPKADHAKSPPFQQQKRPLGPHIHHDVANRFVPLILEEMLHIYACSLASIIKKSQILAIWFSTVVVPAYVSSPNSIRLGIHISSSGLFRGHRCILPNSSSNEPGKDGKALV